MKTFKSLRENDLLASVHAAAKSAGIKLKHDTRTVAQRKADTDKMLADRAAAKPKVTPTQMPHKSPDQHMADIHKQIAKSYSSHKPGQYVGDSVELEGDELFEGHYEDADEHMSKANDAHSQGDMLGYHSHMANHHDSMAQWHEEKGRGLHAEKHSEKAEMHADKMHDLATGRMTEAKSAEIRMYNALQKARQDREKAEAEKERLRKGGEELLNPVKRPAPLEPVKEGLFDFLSHPSGEKKKPKLDYSAIRQSAQVRSKSKPKVFNGPEEYNRAKSHNFAEELDNILNPLIEAANAIDRGEYDYEGQMARTQLQTILRNSKDLIDMITDEENMPEWVQSKITLAQDYISTVRDYIQSKEELEEGTFKYHMDKAIEAEQRGDTKKRAQHLENARTAKFAMKTSDYSKNRALLDKHKQMSMSEGYYNDIGPEYGGAGKGRSEDAMLTAKLTRQAKAAAKKAGKTFNTSAEYRLWHKKQKPKKAVKEEVEIEEGMQQTLRKYVPGYAKRQIDNKMDAEKFGKRDVDRDANFHRYKKIQDKLKEQGVAEGKEEAEQIDEISRTTAMNYVRANQEDDAKKMNDPTKRKNPTFKSTVVGKHNKGVSKNTIGFSNAMARISGHKPTTPKKATSEEVVTEEKPGLYANIHAKQRRIKNGSGEHMRKPGSKGAPTAKAFKQAQKTVKENIDAGIEEGLARLISKSIKNVAAVKPTPQQKADIRLNHLNK
jgi:hypothetical protein